MIFFLYVLRTYTLFLTSFFGGTGEVNEYETERDKESSPPGWRPILLSSSLVIVSIERKKRRREEGKEVVEGVVSCVPSPPFFVCFWPSWQFFESVFCVSCPSRTRKTTTQIKSTHYSKAHAHCLSFAVLFVFLVLLFRCWFGCFLVRVMMGGFVFQSTHPPTHPCRLIYCLAFWLMS